MEENVTAIEEKSILKSSDKRKEEKIWNVEDVEIEYLLYRKEVNEVVICDEANASEENHWKIDENNWIEMNSYW